MPATSPREPAETGVRWSPREGTPAAIAHWNRIRAEIKPFPPEWGRKRTNFDIALHLGLMLPDEKRIDLAMRLMADGRIYEMQDANQ